VLLTVLAVAVAGVASAENDGSTWDRYEKGTLISVVKKVSGIGDEHSDGLSAALASDYPTKARLQYTGEIRPIPTPKKGSIDICMKASGVSADAPALFQSEVRFKEGNTAYWIPVQNQLIPAFRHELKPGQMVDVYVILIGLIHHGPKRFECLFLANDFAAVTK
jgi:hypothetical protein